MPSAWASSIASSTNRNRRSLRSSATGPNIARAHAKNSAGRPIFKPFFDLPLTQSHTSNRRQPVNQAAPDAPRRFIDLHAPRSDRVAPCRPPFPDVDCKQCGTVRGEGVEVWRESLIHRGSPGSFPFRCGILLASSSRSCFHARMSFTASAPSGNRSNSTSQDMSPFLRPQSTPKNATLGSIGLVLRFLNLTVYVGLGHFQDLSDALHHDPLRVQRKHLLRLGAGARPCGTGAVRTMLAEDCVYPSRLDTGRLGDLHGRFTGIKAGKDGGIG